jgi:hypothetical protein
MYTSHLFFVKFELYKASFDKHLLEFTSKSLEKKILEKLFLPHVCIQRKCDLPDMKDKNSNKHENPSPSPTSVIKWLAPKRVVIDQKLHIQ